ncbi:MAG: hypothetical protein FJ395_06265 [Verrucomicrobia bacterium]|nr:hypothetical protein [Verrucomicrobiota bacterium]
MTEIEQRQTESLRRLGIAGRLQMAFSMFDFARERLATFLRSRNPNWSPEQIQRAIADRMKSKHA